MKKFKFILLFVAALGMTATSCSKDDDDTTPVVVTPNIDFKGGSDYISSDATVTAGEDFKIGITASSNANSGKKLTSVKYTVTSNNVVVLEHDSVFSETNYNLDYIFRMDDAGSGVFKFVVTDKDGEMNTISLTVTAEAATTPLTAATDTFFERVGGADGTGLEGFGLKWNSNAKVVSAVIQKDAATKLVMLSPEAWALLTTVEELVVAVDAAADMDAYKGISVEADGTYDEVIACIHNGEYHMIHLTSADVSVDQVSGTTVKIYGQSKK